MDNFTTRNFKFSYKNNMILLAILLALICSCSQAKKFDLKIHKEEV